VYIFGVDALARFFTRDAEVQVIVVSLTWIVALSQPVNAAAYVFDGILIGATDTRYLRNAMVLSAGAFVAVATAGWMTAGLSLPLVWGALLAFMTMRAVTLGIRFRTDVWRDGTTGTTGDDGTKPLT